MFKRHKAAEQRSFEEGLERLEDSVCYAKTLIARLNRVKTLEPASNILDIGSGQGRLLISFTKLGFKAVGLEPWEDAHLVANQLAEHENVKIAQHKGAAEDIPLPSEEFDVVVATSVIEHVLDVKAVFKEVYRVLRPGGLFWFSASSSLCPRQGEIGLFPCFGWYPNRLKLRIMQWAKENKPHLIGYTQTPAINWFTPRKARAMLHKTGFREVYDRWDMRLASEGGWKYRMALGFIKLNKMTKLLADLCVPDSSYTAVK